MNFNEEENCINAHLRVTVLISLHKQMGRTELLPFTPNVCVLRCRRVRLRRELCSALGAATGEDLAAFCPSSLQDVSSVSGSHSLSEAMHLGSVTLSGLIGTNSCHGIYTSCKNMLNSGRRYSLRRSESKFSCSYGAYDKYYSRYPLDLSIFFCIFAQASVLVKSLHISALYLHEGGIWCIILCKFLNAI